MEGEPGGIDDVGDRGSVVPEAAGDGDADRGADVGLGVAGLLASDEAGQLADDRLGIRHQVLVEEEVPRVSGGGLERAAHVGEPELDALLERHRIVLTVAGSRRGRDVERVAEADHVPHRVEDALPERQREGVSGVLESPELGVREIRPR